MNSTSTDGKNSPVSGHWMLWIIGGLAGSIAAVAFLLWGINGATYIVDLIAAFCG
jgi:hypothetical protein